MAYQIIKWRITLKGRTSIIRRIVARHHVSKREINPEFNIKKYNQAKLAGNWTKPSNMALRRFANNEQFITPVRGLYSENAITVEEFKDRNASLLKNRWIDTTHGIRGEKIYEMFDAETDGANW